MSAGLRRARLLPLCAIVLLAVALAASPALAAKPKPKRNLPRQILSSGKVNLPIPDAGAEGPGALRSTVTGPKRLKGLPIGDVDLSMRVSADDVFDLSAQLTSPNGTTVFLVGESTSGGSWGSGQRGCGGRFLTLDDETPFSLVPFAGGPLPDSLGPPYAGRAQPDDSYPLVTMNGGATNGRWTLRIFDDVEDLTGTLHCWRVEVKPHRAR
ncbi:MAG: hypothetical protein EXQ70_04685 [Solirubrobacterales bacterium]|nr:hypothetical protein [Solirubrobacterales bacterium]